MAGSEVQFGVCVPVEYAGPAKEAGWSFVEVMVANLLEPATSDEVWDGLSRARSSALPVLAANRLLPDSLKVVGPDASIEQLSLHMTRVVRRAAAVGIQILVFGSGPARMVPEGFDRGRAARQILEFGTMAAAKCASHGITLVAEPLNRGECNIINSVAEAMQYVKTIGRPDFQCLVDSYHLWLENEPLENVCAAMPWIRHVHLADVARRAAPGDSGKNDYRPLFEVLKGANYHGLITVESTGLEAVPDGARHVLEFLKHVWNAA